MLHLRLFEIALVLVRLDHVARVIVNANRGAWRRAREREQFGDRDLNP